MASVASLRAHLVDELANLLSAEEQLVDVLWKMAERASSPKLRAAFQRHLAETRIHAERLAEGLKLLGEQVAGRTREAMKRLLEEEQELMESSDSGSLRDAMLITAAQKVEHHEIASYGTARTYAEVLGERDVARLLAQTLKEERAADKRLSDIASTPVTPLGSVGRFCDRGCGPSSVRAHKQDMTRERRRVRRTRTAS
jgi:ferritin-like metal-binding protein YciE